MKCFTEAQLRELLEKAYAKGNTNEESSEDAYFAKKSDDIEELMKGL